MLRLDPACPPLWRTATELQFGADPTVVVDDPTPWQERLLHELCRGVPDVALEPVARMLGAPPAAAEPFVRSIAGALEPVAAGGVPAVRLRVPSGIAPIVVEAFTGVLTDFAGAVEVGESERLLYETPAHDAVVVLIADHLVDPRHAAALVRSDAVHLPVVLSGRQVTVGPLVRPGVTACLACVAARRRDVDGSWPLVAAQLLGRPGVPPSRAMATEAAIAAGRMLSAPEREIGHSVTISAD